MKHEDEALGPTIRSLRVKLGLTLDKMALELGCTRTAIYFWEHNRSFPSVHFYKKLVKLAKQFNIDL